MKKIFISLGLCLASLLMFALAAVPHCHAYGNGSGIPSCHDDIAAKNTGPGTSPECTPLLIVSDKALNFLQEFSVRKINKKWYLFISAEEFAGKMDAVARWKTISLLVSAVTSQFGEEADCFIARVPGKKEEKEALLAGDYPQGLIAAAAHHVVLSEEEQRGKMWPEYHHHSLYTLTVY
ncbi:MAG: hypothetical protein KKC76_14920 [Proteobacteria bacterium]|nr:hypothetical protein [Pseudomonadota bacterium]MBU4296966.1 hypothetical protein [Pseudomonadota bacterium]MCG2748564.1 hypothetical protein [Desulfobulbaceae bacterium]